VGEKATCTLKYETKNKIVFEKPEEELTSYLCSKYRDFLTQKCIQKIKEGLHTQQYDQALQGSQQQEVKFQDPIFRKFQDIFVGFTRLKTQKKLIFMCS